MSFPNISRSQEAYNNSYNEYSESTLPDLLNEICKVCVASRLPADAQKELLDAAISSCKKPISDETLNQIIEQVGRSGTTPQVQLHVIANLL